jgi:hypothetical protein
MDAGLTLTYAFWNFSRTTIVDSFLSPFDLINKLAMSAPTNNNRKRALYRFWEARKIARGHGFETKEEILEYSCPGAYQLPKNPDQVWKEDWKGWDDWLGIGFPFEEGRDIARGLNVQSKDDYLKLFQDKKIDDSDPASRLPYRPDLKYKLEWKGWEDWLGL